MRSLPMRTGVDSAESVRQCALRVGVSARVIAAVAAVAGRRAGFVATRLGYALTPRLLSRAGIDL